MNNTPKPEEGGLRWFDGGSVELRMSGKAYRLITRLIIERDRSKFTDAENKALDTWAAQ